MIRNVYDDLMYVGNAIDARDLKYLYDNEIKAVVDLAVNEKPAQLGREMIYYRFPLNDGNGNSDTTIALAIRTLVSLVKEEIPTLVACSAGMSRSPAIAAAVIAMLTGKEPDQCLARVIEGAPNDVSPILWSHVKRVYGEVASR